MSPSSRDAISRFLGLDEPPESVPWEETACCQREGYQELRIAYQVGNERIPAFLLLPDGARMAGAVLVQHQHASEWHWGKSEVAGRVGNPLQAFGPALACLGWVVLAPDAPCFEDRRAHRQGTEPGEAGSDWLQHYNAMAHRLVRGELLMWQVLTEALASVSLLVPLARGGKVGTLGHSYGGNTVLFHAALDLRVDFACASGAACSYRHKIASGTGLEMAEAIPGFAARWDIDDLLQAIAPRPLLLVSSPRDPYSADAEVLDRSTRPAYERDIAWVSRQAAP